MPHDMTDIKCSSGAVIKVPTGLFINNEFVPSIEGNTLDVLNPFGENKIATLAAASAADIDRAVSAASKAYESHWRHSLPGVKSSLLLKLADLIERDADEIATIEAVDAGILFGESKHLHVPNAVETLRYFATLTHKASGLNLKIPGGTAYTAKEPFGVCAAIVPWNAPLMITIWKLAAAMASGNVLIIKTPELAPLYGQKLAQWVKEAGFPPGVVQITCGLGQVAGKAIAEHMKIRKLAFTGSTPTGRSLLRAAAASNLKKVSLELGGKSASIVFQDADLPNAVHWTHIGSSANNGQVCALGSRIYVQESIYDQFVNAFRKHASSQPTTSGDPLDPKVNKGPVISKQQHEKIFGYVEKSKQEGAKILLGGTNPGKGNFVDNTIFVDVREDMTVVKEEVFGPVATISKFRNEADVIAMANDSELGLNAAVFTNDVSRAHRVSDALEVGTVTVNCWGMLHPNTPFGGVKQSGYGRDMGEQAIEDWTTTKTVKFLFLPEQSRL